MLNTIKKSGMGLFVLILFCLQGNSSPQGTTGHLKFQDPWLSNEERVADLVSRLSLKEKVLQMQNLSLIHI